MAREDGEEEVCVEEGTLLSRRRFLRGTAAGLGGAVAAGSLAAPAVADDGREAISWDVETDIVVIGAGASGLPASIAARDEGAEVIVVEHHFDIGGIAIMSGGNIAIGGGNRLQVAVGQNDSPDQVFARITRPVEERFADRALVRRYVDEQVATFDFLEANGVNFDRHGTAVANEGSPGVTSATQVRPHEWPVRVAVLSHDQGRNGSGIVRPLELSARNKGVQFLLSHTVTEIHREQPFAGRVTGVRVEEVDRWFQPVHRVLNIRARKGIIICSGGHGHNVAFRTMFDPRLTEEYQWHGQHTAVANGVPSIAAIRIGAALGSTGNETQDGTGNAPDKGRWGVQDNYVRGAQTPESATFFRHRATGLTAAFGDVLLVKENGLRFWDETDNSEDGYFAHALEPTGVPGKLLGGGPVWAIFDAETVARRGYGTSYPDVDRAGGYFFSGETLEELAGQLHYNQYQLRPMPGDVLRETVERFNSFVDTGTDADFGRTNLQHKIQTPPFYAAWSTPVLHDSYTGLRATPECQVVDMTGRPIPGLYVAGESLGGIKQHGLGRCIATGRIAGRECVRAS
ncbi:MAG: FAD-dependent oxidoreductase [Bauldia sp.]|nr:FAD-dependent oxidoreductase [Bauldia sp.]